MAHHRVAGGGDGLQIWRVKSQVVPVLQVSTTPRWGTGGVEVELHPFLTSALDGGEWSASRRGRFTPGTVGPRVGLDAAMKNSQPMPELETPIIQPVAQRYTAELPLLLDMEGSCK
jgi:hypothetical protein